MENKKRNMGLYILVGILLILVLLLGGYIVYDKVISSNSQKELSNSEINELNIFFNKMINSQFSYVHFDEYSQILERSSDNTQPYGDNLELAITTSEKASENDGEHQKYYTISLEQIKEQLKELTNYNFSEEQIKEYFIDYYDADENIYKLYRGGATSLTIYTITESYKKDNNYYITLSNGSNVVLQKINNQYYFYSSTGIGE